MECNTSISHKHPKGELPAHSSITGKQDESQHKLIRKIPLKMSGIFNNEKKLHKNKKYPQSPLH
jgi:hypothetical protein